MHQRIQDMQQHAQASQAEAEKAAEDLKRLEEETRHDHSTQAMQRLEAAKQATQALHAKAEDDRKVVSPPNELCIFVVVTDLVGFAGFGPGGKKP